ncbi:MAG: glycosyltransferase family 32 protein [Phycisphaerales bacterium]
MNLTVESGSVPATFSSYSPRTIVQYWDNLERLPGDVGECIKSWRPLAAQGFDVRLFDDHGARAFIASRLGPRYENAYLKCYHPAMRSDYFRLCYILEEGGCYIDADDAHNGLAIDRLFDDGRLKIQPLCYDIETERMVPPAIFTEPGADAPTWIFYFNNNPLLAAPGHPIIERALADATETLEIAMSGELPEIQSTTGPGNLTRSIYALAQQNSTTLNSLLVLRNWEDVACSRWPLSYRSDSRNWRLSNCREYQPPGRSAR